jgi:hypothetical protein
MKSYAIVPIVAAAMIGLTAAPAEAQATRTWVSGVGNDANACSREAPCKTFAGAISKTADGGEINCLDPGGFGAVTIVKSITIDCDGTLGSVLAAGGINGVNVNGANIIVTLRNIAINGAGSGLRGINFVTGAQLNVHNVMIFGFKGGSATGIHFAPNTGNSVLLVTNSSITDNGIVPSTGGGIGIQPAAGGSAFVTIENTRIQFNTNAFATNSNAGPITATVRDSVISSNNAGIVSAGANTVNMLVERTTINNTMGIGVNAASAATTIRLDSSKITGNTTGLASGAGVTRSFGNNVIEGNGTNGAPTQTTGLQ